MINFPSIKELPIWAKKSEFVTKKFFARLKKTQPKSLDTQMQQIHEAVFENFDCITCANCCKTTSPILYQKDIERLADHLRLRPSVFIEKYLRIDEDKDYVFKTAPCPFLHTDNYCSVYDNRPTACKEYPHTNRKRFYQLLDLTLKNTFVCPAAYVIVERMKKEIK